jgi:hypothetical protein
MNPIFAGRSPDGAGHCRNVLRGAGFGLEGVVESCYGSELPFNADFFVDVGAGGLAPSVAEADDDFAAGLLRAVVFALGWDW